jgi:glycosyltransferase involved in cell wall biosynthesis
MISSVTPIRARVAIDARKLHDFGIGTYIRNLLTGLARLDRETEFVAFCRAEDCARIAALGPNFRGIPEHAGHYSIAEQVRIPLALRRARAGLFHEPHYVLPPLVPCRSVVTIHDCIHLMFPEYLPNRFAYYYARGALAAAARRADRILTVSETSREDIVRLLNVPADKITVIYNAIDEQFWSEPSVEAIRRVQERYQLYDPFLLYAGNVKPHKNVDRLIDAFAIVSSQGFDRLKLIVIGDEISAHTGLRRKVLRYKLHKQIRFLGFQPQETLAIMYRLASAFVFPSLYEGFGLPPIEAMASGTPVVTSNVSSLAEVAGDAAILVDPYNPEAIADGIIRAISDAPLRADLITRGLARARSFSWEQSVRRIHQIYADIA